MDGSVWIIFLFIMFNVAVILTDDWADRRKRRDFPVVPNATRDSDIS